MNKIDKRVEAFEAAIQAAHDASTKGLSEAEEFKFYLAIAQRLAFHAGDYIGMGTQDEIPAGVAVTEAAAAMRAQAMVYCE
jgi:hypothetical protein